MRKRLTLGLLGLSLVAGLAFAAIPGGNNAGADQPQTGSGYVCPLNGETLPCPACCPAK